RGHAVLVAAAPARRGGGMMSDEGIAEVLAAERERAAAVVARDGETLATLLHDGLTYIHATGVRHDRAQLLQFVLTGPRFLAVELVAPQVQLHGACAIVTGDLHLRLQREPTAEPIAARSLASEVWLRNAALPHRWRLALFQSTRVGA
ncbi:MAG: nuclear transport factor 2 family protein, partial [Aquabacterium sp.]|nr:nuclear transport factor 2 family protein [Aquabacterium sp.]